MSEEVRSSLIPIYNSNGDVDAYLSYPHLYNRSGDWIGFVTEKRQVYSVLGYYVGYISDDRRILRKRVEDTLPRLQPPPRPKRIVVPASAPLAPLMKELTHSIIDVLLEEPERLHTADSGELREDLD
jgi:hypothetical protein